MDWILLESKQLDSHMPNTIPIEAFKMLMLELEDAISDSITFDHYNDRLDELLQYGCDEVSSASFSTFSSFSSSSSLYTSADATTPHRDNREKIIREAHLEINLTVQHTPTSDLLEVIKMILIRTH